MCIVVFIFCRAGLHVKIYSVPYLLQTCVTDLTINIGSLMI